MVILLVISNSFDWFSGFIRSEHLMLLIKMRKGKTNAFQCTQEPFVVLVDWRLIFHEFVII